MDVTVRKTNGSYEEYDKVKLMNGIREAYKTAGEECPEAVVVSIAENLYIYDKITAVTFLRQLSATSSSGCPLMYTPRTSFSKERRVPLSYSPTFG